MARREAKHTRTKQERQKWEMGNGASNKKVHRIKCKSRFATDFLTNVTLWGTLARGTMCLVGHNALTAKGHLKTKTRTSSFVDFQWDSTKITSV
jgi:hypothetical protein